MVTPAMMTHPRWPWIVALIAIVLTLPSLRVGWLLDDHFHRLVLARPDVMSEWHRSSTDMFRFLDGDAERTLQMMDKGYVPWWTYPNLLAAFWRPVTTLTHRLDYRLWPDSPAIMHLQSVLWYGLLAGAVAVLYRRIFAAGCAIDVGQASSLSFGPVSCRSHMVAGLAALLYAVDDAHGMPVGWLANRNAVLATFFGVLAIIAHDAWRSRGVRWAAVVGPALLGLSVLSAEAGISTCGYLLAYALFIEDGSRKRRLASLLPYLAVIVIWRIAWVMQGYGTNGLGLYADPLHDPATFIIHLVRQAPVLLLGQWAVPPADVTLFMGTRGLWLLWAVAVVVLAGLAVLLWPVVRSDRTAKFWAAGMLMSVVPVCATFPSDRLLFFVGIGAMGLLALFLRSAFDSAMAGRRFRWKTLPAIALIGIHLVIAPIALAVRSAYPGGPEDFSKRLMVQTPLDERVTDQDVVIVNAPSTAHAVYLATLRTLNNQPVPRRTWVLAPAVPSVTVARIDDSALKVSPADGYLNTSFETLFRNDRHPMAVGEQVRLTGLNIEVTALTADRRPAEAVFEFDRSLESSSLRWLQYKNGEFVPFTPPAVGQTVVLYAEWPW